MSSELPPKDPNLKDKESDASKQEGHNNLETFYDYAKANTLDVVAYALLTLGIILFFFRPLFGGLLIGIIAGIYFSKELIAIIKDFEGYVERLGLVRSIVLAVALLAFFISAPSIFIGIVLAVILKYFIQNV